MRAHPPDRTRERRSTSATPFSHPTVGFLARNYVELLAALVLLFILQGSLIPLDFTATRSGEGSRVFFDARISDFTCPDIIINSFLYLPLGVMVHWLIYRGMKNWFLAMLLTIDSATDPAVWQCVFEFVNAFARNLGVADIQVFQTGKTC